MSGQPLDITYGTTETGQKAADLGLLYLVMQPGGEVWHIMLAE